MKLQFYPEEWAAVVAQLGAFMGHGNGVMIAWDAFLQGVFAAAGLAYNGAPPGGSAVHRG